MTDKLWGGRFTEKAAHWVDAFGASIGFDQQMAQEDLEGSLAHVKMLGKTASSPKPMPTRSRRVCSICRRNWLLANCTSRLKMRISILIWKPC